jgi:hypothetical protein
MLVSLSRWRPIWKHLSQVSQQTIFQSNNFFTASFWLTILLIVGLTVTIIVGFWFLHIVFSAYHYFVCRRLELWDHQPENKRLLIEEPAVLLNIHKKESTDSDPAKDVLLPKELRQDEFNA